MVRLLSGSGAGCFGQNPTPTWEPASVPFRRSGGRRSRGAGAPMSEWQEAEQHVERAHELYELGRWEEAESELRRAIAMNPYQSEWQFNLGLTLDAAGRYTEAVEVFKEAYTLDPEDGQAALMVGVSLLRSEDARGSLEWLDRAEKLEPGSVTPFVHRIEAYTRIGNHEQAEIMFYLAQQVDPKAADAYLAMADSLL